MSNRFARLWLAATVTVGVFCLQSASAQSTNSIRSPVDNDCNKNENGRQFLTLSLLHENDFFNLTDRQYTSGTLVSAAYNKYGHQGGEPCLGDHRDWAWRAIDAWIDKDLLEHAFVFALGQQLFTPSFRQGTEIQSDDRPFAGWLFGRWALHGFGAGRSQTITLDLGMVGPAAGGEATQNYFHAVDGYERFRGWRNQLRNEFGVQLSSEWREVAWRGQGNALVGHYGGALGNVETYLNAGLRWQFGARGLNDFRMPPSMRAASPIAPPKTRTSAQQVPAHDGGSAHALQAFAGFDLRAVAHNIFLDGNTSKPGHHVRRRPLVADLSAGFSWRWAGFDFAYTHGLRTREFFGQGDYHVFGGISIGMTLD